MSDCFSTTVIWGTIIFPLAFCLHTNGKDGLLAGNVTANMLNKEVSLGFERESKLHRGNAVL